jgi:glycogen operon protein
VLAFVRDEVGEGGYQVGEFPPLWTEWNGKFRDTVRDVWRGHGSGVRELAYRLSGSSDLYQDDGRRPYASINFVTAHDGFTLRDLTTYEVKRNEANGEDNRDGTEDNRSWNCGAEGPSSDPAVERLRLRQAKNLLSTLLLSTGVPMLTMGDELRRTQGGNNNAYCQDNPISWVDWDVRPDQQEVYDLVRQLLALRRQHPVFRQKAFFSGAHSDEDGVKDIAWFGADGQELTDDHWFDSSVTTLGMYLNGAGIRTRGPRGERVVDDSFLVVLHMGGDDLEVQLPREPWATSYEVLVDTAGALAGTHECGSRLPVTGRCVLVLRAVR